MSQVRALAALRAGALVGFPTETVFGLGADVERPEAVAQIFAAKGRPGGKPLTVHLGPSVDPSAWGILDHRALALAERFWPGPLTLVVPARPGVALAARAGGASVGLRVPDHPVAIRLLDAFGAGVATTSANLSGQPSPAGAEAVRALFGDTLAAVLDGDCAGGVASTVLLLHPSPRILRAGGVSAADLAEVLGSLPPLATPPTPIRG